MKFSKSCSLDLQTSSWDLWDACSWTRSYWARPDWPTCRLFGRPRSGARNLPVARVSAKSRGGGTFPPPLIQTQNIPYRRKFHTRILKEKTHTLTGGWFLSGNFPNGLTHLQGHWVRPRRYRHSPETWVWSQPQSQSDRDHQREHCSRFRPTHWAPDRRSQQLWEG